MNKAILLSGGIDSTCLVYLYRDEISLAITIDYGQKSARAEINASKRICQMLNINHEIISIDCTSLGSGEMSRENMMLSIAPSPEWWPYRNQLIITLAAMKAIHQKIETLIIGTVKSDKKFSDGSKRFFNAINKCISLQEGNIKVETPAIKLSSTELVIESQIPDGLLLYTHSCHTSNNPCGNCNGCRKYFYVMKTVGIT